jgi:hypothetical protein
MNKNETSNTTNRNIHIEESKASEATLCDLEPRAEVKGGSIYNASDVTLKRGIIE